MIDTALACTRHPKRETRLSCGRCGRPFCTGCLTQTPVGLRCKECGGGSRALTMSPFLLGRALAGGVLVSAIAWLLLQQLPFFRFFLAVLVGVAVGETVDRLGRKRRGRPLEVVAGVAVVVGLAFAQVLTHLTAGMPLFEGGMLYGVGLPALLAVIVAVVKVR